MLRLLGRGVLAASVLALAVWAMWAADAPAQPLPFSHKAHAGTLKLQCKMCHPNPDPGEVMRIAGLGVAVAGLGRGICPDV